MHGCAATTGCERRLSARAVPMTLPTTSANARTETTNAFMAEIPELMVQYGAGARRRM